MQMHILLTWRLDVDRFAKKESLLLMCEISLVHIVNFLSCRKPRKCLVPGDRSGSLGLLVDDFTTNTNVHYIYISYIPNF
ncbi:uncharacterized protein PHALS_14838 [Plasmopara halstedii]|uniref:Uncharacterized protein n=1 Tax=Plasmopara halstedii TaxID=4781 RepID=A0A0P1AUU7_PLAHL|nr:uncharacterized protein PHALS_14838 [Plasmopara halstedii]CEG45740.1 hypothetical protein PHALS_14838 [Plasmopara halstedii]|eukprot:XP_024582109.1 hypothetical protein PHALS_14838 [Plasmopara halstedii]